MIVGATLVVALLLFGRNASAPTKPCVGEHFKKGKHKARPYKPIFASSVHHLLFWQPSIDMAHHHFVESFISVNLIIFIMPTVDIIGYIAAILSAICFVPQAIRAIQKTPTHFLSGCIFCLFLV